MQINLEELKEIYEEVQEKVLEVAERLQLNPEYAYENESGTEAPEGFNYFGNSFSIRDSKLFNVMIRGNLDQLKELLDNSELFSQYVEEIFGTQSQYVKEIGSNTETEREFCENLKEAA